MNFTLQEKYDFLCSQIELWGDYLILESGDLQFGSVAPETVDDAIALWMSKDIKQPVSVAASK